MILASIHPLLTCHHRLEVLNSVVLRNLSDNPNLIYGILMAHKVFEDLGTLTLSGGLREIRRSQLAKEEQARKTESNAKKKSIGEEAGNEEEPHDEKARLLESEGGGFVDLEKGTVGDNEPESPSRAWENTTLDVGVSGTHPLSPTTTEDSQIVPGATPTLSEKARGKMKARRSMSMDTSGGLERIAAESVGRNGFVPTQEWVRLLLPLL
jgi:hypothetical protein